MISTDHAPPLLGPPLTPPTARITLASPTAMEHAPHLQNMHHRALNREQGALSGGTRHLVRSARSAMLFEVLFAQICSGRASDVKLSSCSARKNQPPSLRAKRSERATS